MAKYVETYAERKFVQQPAAQFHEVTLLFF